jgi:ABC-type branched-subunit amino acid transport system ATPase component
VWPARGTPAGRGRRLTLIASIHGPTVAIAVEGLTKVYGEQRAVDALSFGVRPGAVTGFLGPNGAGKTTTLRMVWDSHAPPPARP